MVPWFFVWSGGSALASPLMDILDDTVSSFLLPVLDDRALWYCIPLFGTHFMRFPVIALYISILDKGDKLYSLYGRLD